MNPFAYPQFNGDTKTGEVWLEAIGEPPMPMCRVPVIKEGLRYFFMAFGKKVWLNEKDTKMISRLFCKKDES
jgi:hypothetical protein